MGNVTIELIGELKELIAFLRIENEDHWCSWFKKCLSMLENSDYQGIERVLGAYGGMGSFNDLVLTKKLEDGTYSMQPDANNHLDKLRNSISDKAVYIKNNHETNS
jgi:hypothetical protein